MSSYEADLIRRARDLQRLVTKRRRLKRNLRAVELEIRHARKLLKAIQLASEDRRPDVMPNRLDAGVTGFPLPPIVCKVCGEPAGETGSMSGLVHKHGPTDHPFEPSR